MGAGKILLIIGAVLTGIALIMFIVGIVAFPDMSPESQEVARGTGTFKADLSSGDKYTVWTEGLLDVVNVTAPSGADVTDELTLGDGFIIESWTTNFVFTAAESGDYTIEVTPATSEAIVSDHFDADEVAGGFMASVLGVCGALVLGIPGIILLIIGLILTLTQKKETPAAQPAAGAPAPGQPQQPAPGSYEAMYGSPPPQQPPQ